jgi:hypothetical protein
MQRYSRLPAGPTDFHASSAGGTPFETHKVLPDSFADWLAQPSHTITAGQEAEQGIFVGLLGECQVQVSAHPPLASGHE